MRTDLEFMARALQLAERGRFTTDPNPRVGCVLVKSGRIIGEGFHERAGQAHAEINALKMRAKIQMARRLTSRSNLVVIMVKRRRVVTR